ncbi:MAG: M23 family metallopeptidase [Bacteroidetes bacterium]|nr:M23 family metallopeptidase [Bacteroidota bacterium]
MADRIKTRRDSTLKNKFRFVVLNDETFEEKFSLTLTRMNVWVFISTIAVVLVMLTASAIIYTPLKYFIPGFGDYNYRSQIVALTFRTDSLEQQLEQRALYLDDIAKVVSGSPDTSGHVPPVKRLNSTDTSRTIGAPSEDEMQLRKDVDEEESYALNYKDKKSGAGAQLGQFHFFSPVEGYVTEEYDPQAEHYGIDVAAKADAPVKATLDGTIISSGWSAEYGYVVAIQHKDNIVSIYKHNSKIFKNVGNFVHAGDVIAAVGSTGELSSGPHLHFEIWHGGTSLNPRDYVIFN